MFQVKIDIGGVQLDGCPESGVGAVDFRRQHNLPVEPSSWVALKWEGESEPLCRRYPVLVNGDADLHVHTYYEYRKYGFGTGKTPYDGRRFLSADPHRGDGLYHNRVSPDTARPFLDGTATVEDVSRLIDELHAQAVAASAELDAKNERERVEKEARDAERKAREEAAKLAKAEAEKRQAAEVAAWAAANGSDRLRRCVAEGIECRGVYRDERLAKEYPGWRFDGSSLPNWNEPRNPPAEALELLDKARASLPADWTDADRQLAELAFWERKVEDGYGDTERHTGYVVTVTPEWTDGSSIVFGYDGPENE